jgi:hypothetical protein
MPPLPDAAKVLRVAVEYGVEFQTNVNVFHMRYSGAGNNQTDLDVMTTTIYDAAQAFLLPLQDVDSVSQQIVVTDLTSSTALTSQISRTNPGTHSGGMTPANCALCVSWKIHRRYRGGHPRTYVGGIPISAYLDERAFTTTYVALAHTRASTFISDIAVAGEGAYGTLEFGNLSYFSGGSARVTPVFDPILSAFVNARPDSQRRRLGKVAG